MRFFAVAYLKDVRRFLRDPLAIGLAVGLPLVIGLLLRLTWGGDRPQPTARMLLADHDDSFLSNALAGAFSQGPMAGTIEVEEVTEEKGRDLMEDGKASGLLIIPDGFGEALFDRTPKTLVLLTNPSQRVLPGILEETLGFVVDAVAAFQSLSGDIFDPFTAAPPPGRITFPDSVITATGTRVNALVERGGRFLFPPAIQVRTEVLEEAEPTRGFADLYFPCMLFMAVLFAAQNLSDDVWKERLQGTLRRSVVSPQRLPVFLAAKLAAVTTYILFVGMGGMVAGHFIFGIEIRNIPLAILWAAASGAFMLFLFTLLQLAATSQRGGNLISTLVLFPLIMLGGAFFPFEAMPDWMARIGRMTPNGWALEQLRRILWDTVDPTTLAATAAGMVAGGALLFTLSAARLARFARG